MGTTAGFTSYLSDVNNDFLQVNKNRVEITHLWVDGFGWEDTILIEEDFKKLEKLEGVFEGENIMIGVENEGINYRVLKVQ